MKQNIAQIPCLQTLFLYVLCFEMVMVRSDWVCLDYTGLPRSIQLLLYEQHWTITLSAAAQDT